MDKKEKKKRLNMFKNETLQFGYGLTPANWQPLNAELTAEFCDFIKISVSSA